MTPRPPTTNHTSAPSLATQARAGRCTRTAGHQDRHDFNLKVPLGDTGEIRASPRSCGRSLTLRHQCPLRPLSQAVPAPPRPSTVPSHLSGRLTGNRQSTAPRQRERLHQQTRSLSRQRGASKSLGGIRHLFRGRVMQAGEPCGHSCEPFGASGQGQWCAALVHFPESSGEEGECVAGLRSRVPELNDARHRLSCGGERLVDVRIRGLTAHTRILQDVGIYAGRSCPRATSRSGPWRQRKRPRHV